MGKCNMLICERINNTYVMVVMYRYWCMQVSLSI